MSGCRAGKGPRAVLGWAILSFVVVQVVLTAGVEAWHPESFDPEFGARLSLLQARMEEAGDRPLLVVVGSSRILTDFRPEALPPLRSADGYEPLPFNVSHAGGGPLLNLLSLDRLLRAGHRPRWLVIEVMPPFLGLSRQSAVAGCAEARDLPLLARHMSPWKLYGNYLLARFHALNVQRHVFHLWAPSWIPSSWDNSPPLEPLGGTVWKDRPAGNEVGRQVAHVRALYFAGLQQFQVRDAANRAMRELLERCRQEGIEAALVLTPEGSEFRSWYPPEARKSIDQYCAELSQTYNVPIIDARTWLKDDQFVDAHHATNEGSEAFTRRLGEVLQPWMLKEFSRDSQRSAGR